MSTKVVPAPANQATQPVRSDKLAKQSEKQQPVQDDEKRLVEDEVEVELSIDEGEEAPESETSLAGEFEFDGALAEAAAASGSLVTDQESTEVSVRANYGDEDGGGTILLIGAVLLVGAGIAALASGGSNDPADDVPLNEDPTITADADLAVDEDSSGSIAVSADDPDGDVPTISGSADNGTVMDNGDGTWTYTPNPDFNGSDTVTFTADDGNGGTASTTTTVTVAAQPDDPTVSTDVATLTVDEDTSGTVTVTADDPDGDTPTVAGAAANGDVMDNGDGTWTYAPDPDFNGMDTITFTADDGNGGTASTSVDVTVNPVNDAPTVNPASTMSIVTDENTPANFIIDGDDVDGDDIFILNSGPSNGTLSDGGDNDDTTFTYTPDPDFFGTDDFDITLDDNNGGTVTYTVSVTVNEQTGPTPLSIDVGTPTKLGDIGGAGFDDATGAGLGPTIFTDDGLVQTNVEIGSFGTDDVIQVTNATPFQISTGTGDYSFGTSGDDLEVIWNDGTNFTSIIIDLAPGTEINGLVFDYDSAVAAVGFEFMTFG